MIMASEKNHAFNEDMSNFFRKYYLNLKMIKLSKNSCNLYQNY